MPALVAQRNRVLGTDAVRGVDRAEGINHVDGGDYKLSVLIPCGIRVMWTRSLSIR
jgi:hypothetical protein